MQTVYIKFISQEHREKGFYELVTHARVASFPGHLYQVPISALALLEKENIGFRRATDAEIRSAHDQVRNPSPALL